MPSGIYQRTKKHSHAIKKGLIGKHFPKGTHWKISPDKRKNMGRGKGEKSVFWKGDDVKYRALHDWVRRIKGEPLICENCGRKKTTPKSIHWANKSHKYLRIESDWISLCVRCHKKYDA